MHPQQQRRMIELLRGRYKQCVLSTHAPGILDHCQEAEILRLHRKLELSSCDLDSEAYDLLLRQTAKVSKATSIAKVARESVELKFVVYECGSLKVTDSNGNELVNVAAKKKPNEIDSSPNEDEEISTDFGAKDTLWVSANERLEFEVEHPDDVSVYIDGETIVLEDYLVAGEDFAKFTHLNGVNMDASSDAFDASIPMKADDPSQVKLKVVLGEYATVRVTDTNDDVLLYLDSGKTGKSEIYSIGRQKACFEIANTSEVALQLGQNYLDFSPFQSGDTAYFELDLNTMEFIS